METMNAMNAIIFSSDEDKMMISQEGEQEAGSEAIVGFFPKEEGAWKATKG